jgi:hypothetical protein
MNQNLKEIIETVELTKEHLESLKTENTNMIDQLQNEDSAEARKTLEDADNEDLAEARKTLEDAGTRLQDAISDADEVLKLLKYMNFNVEIFRKRDLQYSLIKNDIKFLHAQKN